MDLPTESDLIAHLSADHVLQIADKDGDGTADSAFITTHLARANTLAVSIAGEIDPTPAYLTGAQCDVAAYLMAKESRASLAEEHRKGFDDAIAMFHALRAPEFTGAEREFTISNTDGLI